MQQHTRDRTKEKDGAERERGGLWPTHCVCLLRKQQATERVTDSLMKRNTSLMTSCVRCTKTGWRRHARVERRTRSRSSLVARDVRRGEFRLYAQRRSVVTLDCAAFVCAARPTDRTDVAAQPHGPPLPLARLLDPSDRINLHPIVLPFVAPDHTAASATAELVPRPALHGPRAAKRTSPSPNAATARRTN